MELNVKVGVSNRHVHLTQEVYNQLFDHEPTIKAELTQPGMYAYNECVTLRVGEKEIKNVSCNVSALNKIEYRLTCKPNELLNGKILKGFSYLNNSNLIIIFNENRNNINVDPSNSHSSTYRIYTKKKKGLSSGEIVAIIVPCSCASIIILLVILFNKRKMLRKRQFSNDSTFCSVKNESL